MPRVLYHLIRLMRLLTAPGLKIKVPPEGFSQSSVYNEVRKWKRERVTSTAYAWVRKKKARTGKRSTAAALTILCGQGSHSRAEIGGYPHPFLFKHENLEFEIQHSENSRDLNVVERNSFMGKTW